MQRVTVDSAVEAPSPVSDCSEPYATRNIDVSVIVPCRNEKAYIRRFIECLTSQSTTRECEYIIADGESDDGTSELLEQWRLANHRIHIISNPRRIVASGLNAALAIACGAIIIRMDVHGEYPQHPE